MQATSFILAQDTYKIFFGRGFDAFKRLELFHEQFFGFGPHPFDLV